jgi:hypothetical protein
MSTTTLFKTTIAGLMATCLFGCAFLGNGYPVGSIYTATQIPHGINRNETSGQAKAGEKRGEACATGYLFAVAFGDASLDAAKKAGGITEVHSVEFHGTSILGLYTQGCTEVHGK